MIFIKDFGIRCVKIEMIWLLTTPLTGPNDHEITPDLHRLHSRVEFRIVEVTISKEMCIQLNTHPNTHTSQRAMVVYSPC